MVQVPSDEESVNGAYRQRVWSDRVFPPVRLVGGFYTDIRVLLVALLLGAVTIWVMIKQ